MPIITYTQWLSPVGNLILGSFENFVCMCDWNIADRSLFTCNRFCRLIDAKFVEGSSSTIERMITELEEYFSQKRQSFDLPLRFVGSSFQCKVWSELTKIPFGSTTSYADIAIKIGNKNSVRAVANAIAANPISIIVPCHRIIGSNGKLTGYAGGLDAKSALLNLEI